MELSEVDLEMKCPVCHRGRLRMLYKVTKIPHFGSILVMSIVCPYCGMKLSDVYALSERGDLPEVHETKFDERSSGDLVVLSVGARVTIPEIGYEVTIVDESGGEITTIEGIVREAVDAVRMLMRVSGRRNREVLEGILRRLLKEVERPSGTLTIRIEDKKRRSAIIPASLWTKRAEAERNLQKRTLEVRVKELGKNALRERFRLEES